MKTKLLFIFSSLFLSLLFPKFVCSQNGTLHQMLVTVAGDDRFYFFYEPENYNGTDEWPLVFVFHGFGGSALGTIESTEMYKVADTADFFIIYPQGMIVEDLIWGGANNGWNVPPGYYAEHDDVEFVNSVIDDIIFNPDFGIDTNRIFASGNSNGAEMAFYLACTLSDRIASFAGVAGQMSYELMDNICNPDRPASVLQMLGTNDYFFPVLGDSLFPPLAGTAEYWASLDNCDTIPDTTYLPDLYPQDASTVTLLQYPNCYNGYEVLCYRIEGGNHSWPGGGQGWQPGINQDIDASSELWNFFNRNPHPRTFSFCFPQGITFDSQDEIDNFSVQNPNCNEIQGNVVIKGSDITDLSGLNMVTNIGGSLSIYLNNSLTELNGLSSLSSVGGDLEIGKELPPMGGYGNNLLNDLSGLENLESVGGNLFIAYNNSITSLSGLDNISPSSINGLFIHDNQLLSGCSVMSVCDYLSAPGGIIDIHTNASGCNDSTQVINICNGVFINDPGVIKNLSIYPNPFKSSITIELSSQPSKNTSLTISGTNGKQFFRQPIAEPHTEIDISHLPVGIYIVKVWSDKDVMVQKIIKE